MPSIEKTAVEPQMGRPNRTSNATGETPCVKDLEQYGKVQSELIGKTVVLTGAENT